MPRHDAAIRRFRHTLHTPRMLAMRADAYAVPVAAKLRA